MRHSPPPSKIISIMFRFHPFWRSLSSLINSDIEIFLEILQSRWTWSTWPPTRLAWQFKFRHVEARYLCNDISISGLINGCLCFVEKMIWTKFWTSDCDIAANDYVTNLWTRIRCLTFESFLSGILSGTRFVGSIRVHGKANPFRVPETLMFITPGSPASRDDLGLKWLDLAGQLNL